MPSNGQRVIATGFCSMCDFKFTNELVARFPDRAAPGGWIYIELRHLSAADQMALSAPKPTTDRDPRAARRGDPSA